MRIVLIKSILILLASMVNAQQERAMAREGNEYYKNKDFNKAEINYQKALKETCRL